MKQFRKAALGGTFDRLHIGHEQLLTTALSLADSVVVGVTVDQLVVEKEYAHIIESFDVRYDAVAQWLNTHQSPYQESEVVPLEDVYGPTVTDPTIDCLIVTSQTQYGGHQVNHQRAHLQLPTLPIVEAPMVKDETGEYVSSTRIRQGVITRKGNLFASLFQQDYIFSKETLLELSQLQGRVVDQNQITPAMLTEFSSVVLVGDMVTKTFLDHSLPFNYAIIDGKTKRNQSITIPDITSIPATNPPGTINRHLAHFFLDAYRQTNKVYKIEGEEDLLAFVPVLTTPLMSAIFYGQPNVGIGMITIDEATKLHYAHFINPSFN